MQIFKGQGRSTRGSTILKLCKDDREQMEIIILMIGNRLVKNAARTIANLNDWLTYN